MDTFCIHYDNLKEDKPFLPVSWNTSLNAAKIKHNLKILNIAGTAEKWCSTDLKYHRKCRSMYILKLSDLPNQDSLTRVHRGQTQGGIVLPRKCMISDTEINFHAKLENN